MGAEIETTELGTESATRVEAALTRLLGSGAMKPTSHPDEFEYEISLPERNQRASINEQDIPSDLQPLVAELSRVGRIESPRGPAERWLGRCRGADNRTCRSSGLEPQMPAGHTDAAATGWDSALVLETHPNGGNAMQAGCPCELACRLVGDRQVSTCLLGLYSFGS
jgi:hypothetical protein